MQEVGLLDVVEEAVLRAEHKEGTRKVEPDGMKGKWSFFELT